MGDGCGDRGRRTGGAHRDPFSTNRMGFDYFKRRIIHVKTASGADEIKRLKAELRKAKEMLADEMISHKIDEVALRILCREHNTTPEEVKKAVAKSRM